MRNSSPRLLAGLLALGLFAVVGVFTVRAFAVAPASGSTGSEANVAKIEKWQETRSGSITKP